MTAPDDSVQTTARDGALDVRIRVAPRASRDAVLGVHQGALKVALSAPPVDGEANAALVAFLAKALRVSKSSITLVAGERSREKTVRIAGTTPAAIDALVPSR